MKKIIVMFALGAVAVAGVSAQQAGPSGAGTYRFTLEDCLEYAMGNSYTRQSMELSVRSAEITLEQSKLERLPNLSGSASESYAHSKNNDGSWSGSYGVNTGVTIFNGGNINNTIKQSELQTGQAATRAAQYDNTLTMSILSSYFAILGYEELLRYQESLIAASTEQVRDGRLRYDNQTILKSDYLMLESQHATNLNSVEDTRINLRNELVNLKGLLSMDLGADLAVVNPDTTAFESMAAIPAMDYYLDRSTATLPDLELLDYGVELAETSLRLSKSSLFPTLSLSAGLSTGHAQNFKNWGTQVSDRFGQSAGVSLSIPIFNRNRTRASVQKSRISLQQAELERKQGELDITRTLIESYYNAESALNSYRTLISREEAYRETLRVYNELFRVGQVKPVDLLQQQNNYINVMYDYVQSKYGFMLRRKMLDVYMGLEITM